MVGCDPNYGVWPISSLDICFQGRMRNLRSGRQILMTILKHRETGENNNMTRKQTLKRNF